MSEIIVYVKGEYLSIKNATVSFRDGGFQFGDGLFETIRFQSRNLFSAEKHLHRLRDGLKILELSLDKSNNELISILKNLIHKNNIDTGLLRLMITRGEITGTPWNHTGEPNIYISIRPISFMVSNRMYASFTFIPISVTILIIVLRMTPGKTPKSREGVKRIPFLI